MKNCAEQRFLRSLFVAAAVLVCSTRGAVHAGGALSGERYRVIISSDIGGSDEDDIQSMVHYLLYCDLLDTEGIISSPPGKGRRKDIIKVIAAYEKDYHKLKTWSDTYPAPDYLRSIAKQGAVDPAPKRGYSSPTEGSRWIIKCAGADDPRPLYVLVWGAITDVAQALHDEPAIKKKIRVHFIASWNKKQDPHAFRYIDENHQDLWLIHNDTTFRGWYMGGNQSGDLANKTFVDKHVKGHGALGDYFAPLKGGSIKMGDTPSYAFLLWGTPEDPAGDSWGGRFIKMQGRPNWWVDDPAPSLAQDGRAGAKTVNRWREDYLRNWRKRMDRCVDKGPPAARQPPVYLFTSFRGNGEDGLHLAYSRDGYKWIDLGGPFLKPQAGVSRLMRDPCIIEGPDGIFHMVWTSGWGEKGISYANSRDLLRWSGQKYIEVMAHEPNARNCWAPEIFYDESGRQFLVFWSTTIPGRFPETGKGGDKGWNHRMYCTTTRDFKHFTPTRLFYEPGFNVIDGTIVNAGDRYVMFLKNETRYPPQKNIRMATSKEALGPYGPASPPITGDYWAEGPSAIRIGDHWFVYFDKYRKGQYGAVRSKDLKTWTDVSDLVSFPAGHRHGTVLQVSSEIVNRIIKRQDGAHNP